MKSFILGLLTSAFLGGISLTVCSQESDRSYTITKYRVVWEHDNGLVGRGALQDTREDAEENARNMRETKGIGGRQLYFHVRVVEVPVRVTPPVREPERPPSDNDLPRKMPASGDAEPFDLDIGKFEDIPEDVEDVLNGESEEGYEGTVFRWKSRRKKDIEDKTDSLKEKPNC